MMQVLMLKEARQDVNVDMLLLVDNYAIYIDTVLREICF
jgi:hypothetical protein